MVIYNNDKCSKLNSMKALKVVIHITKKILILLLVNIEKLFKINTFYYYLI